MMGLILLGRRYGRLVKNDVLSFIFLTKIWGVLGIPKWISAASWEICIFADQEKILEGTEVLGARAYE
jgi:hypothetical protein